MTDQISPETFAHLVKLAALQLSPEEGEYLRQQLNNQLKAIQELAAIPLDQDVPITLHGVPYTAANSHAPREDTWLPYPNPEDILGQAPQAEDGYIIVPDIPHTSLE
jgi:aspartyl/glutamyl-tRNA(Asn/Gln) amidotransferase C subunit